MVDAKTSAVLIPWSDISQSSKIGPISGQITILLFFKHNFTPPYLQSLGFISGGKRNAT